MGPDAMILVFWMFSFKPAFSLSSFIAEQKSIVLLCATINEEVDIEIKKKIIAEYNSIKTEKYLGIHQT